MIDVELIRQWTKLIEKDLQNKLIKVIRDSRVIQIRVALII
jgi:hypothetical protein